MQKLTDKQINLFTSLFRDDYEKPIVLAEGQKDIFTTIVMKQPSRVCVRAITQYGKSMTIALALIWRLTAFKEKWAIVAGTKNHARIIGGECIKHIFDNQLFSTQLELTGAETMERLARERNKDHLTFKRGGDLRILTADVHNRKRVGQALMEHGATNLIIDGSGLLDDENYSTAIRMVGGNVRDSFILEAGNPFLRNHFQKTCSDPQYKQINIKSEQAIKEGRTTRAFIENAKTLAFYDILYENEFPEAGSEQVPLDLIKAASEDEDARTGGIKTMGVDVAWTGSDSSCITILDGERQTRQDLIKGNDPMEVTGAVVKTQAEEKCDAIGVDVIGMGAGVYSRLKEQLDATNAARKVEKEAAAREHRDPQPVPGFWVRNLYAVNFAATAAQEPGPGFPGYANVRAEAYVTTRDRVQGRGGFLAPFSDIQLWQEISETKILFDSSGRYKIESKELIKKRLGRSPDRGDALAIAVWCAKYSAWIEPQKSTFHYSQVSTG